MSGTLKMGPGEIYLALEISNIATISLDNLLNIYHNNKDKDWGHIAKEAGIKPGSEEFHRLKNNASNKKSKSNGKGYGNSSKPNPEKGNQKK